MLPTKPIPGDKAALWAHVAVPHDDPRPVGVHFPVVVLLPSVGVVSALLKVLCPATVTSDVSSAEWDFIVVLLPYNLTMLIYLVMLV